MPPETPTQIDEKWLSEYLDFGWHDLIIYLLKHAKFDAWCEKHGRKEQTT